jgi:hypothetical protein
MGPGKNVVLFDASKAEVQLVTYTRIRRVAYFCAPMSEYEDVDQPGSYDYALSDDHKRSS